MLIELLAVIQSINKWSNYVSSNKFYISTDSSNIPSLIKMSEEKAHLNSTHQRWATYLLGLNFDIRHIPGVENKVADFLSRLTKQDIDFAYDSGTVELNEMRFERKLFADNVYALLVARFLPERTTRNKKPRYADSGTTIHPRWLDDPTLKLNNVDKEIMEDLQKSDDDVDVLDATSSSHKTALGVKGSGIVDAKDYKTPPIVPRRPHPHDPNYADDLRDYQDKIIETIEDMQSDHVSSEGSFREDDLSRNQTILQDPLLASELLGQWKHDPKLFNSKQIKRNQRADPLCNTLIEALKKDESPSELPPHLIMMVDRNLVKISDDILYAKLDVSDQWKVYVLSGHRLALMTYFHESPLTMHPGVTATANAIREYFYWPRMLDDIRKFIGCCQICRQAKNFSDVVPLEITPTRSKVFNHVIAIDHKGPLPRTKSGNRYIMNIMDLFSSYVESIPMPRIGASTTAFNIVARWILRFGIPDVILTDQGSDFASAIVAELCDYLGMKKKFSSAYTPQSNGQIERFHRSLSESLKIIVHSRKLSFNEPNAPWDLYLPYITAKHNNQYSRITKMSPNQIALGRKISLPHAKELSKFSKSTVMPEGLKHWFSDLIKVNESKALKNIVEHQTKAKQKAEKKSSDDVDTSYKLGDVVIIREGTGHHLGSDAYDARNCSGTYKIINVYPHGKTFDLEKINKPHEIRKQINYRHLLRYKNDKE